jgi:hypothetical protein
VTVKYGLSFEIVDQANFVLTTTTTTLDRVVVAALMPLKGRKTRSKNKK